jgi:polyferredoxin
VLVYTSILVLICAAFVASIALRSPFRVDVVRDRASLARLVDEGRIENVYRLQIMNATEQQQRYRVAVSGMPGIAVAGGAELSVNPAEARWVTLGVQIPPDAAAQAGTGAHAIQFHVERVGEDGDIVQVTEKSTFIVPR